MSKYPIYDTILARRSIRRFLDKPVEHSQIEMLLKAAMAAPSACNLQPWVFIVVDEPTTLSSVKNATVQGKYNAPLAIVVCGINQHIPWGGDSWMQECGAAVENMLLAGTEMGLASVWIGGFDSEALCNALHIPDGVQPMCIVEIGYPAYEREPLTWYTEEAVHWQKFDSAKPRTMRTMQMLQDDIASGKL
ncbi:MAG TPA: nitroreductase family protein [Candidatus Limiplasma sp.]|nr:nitroreductase family protein [Candidatus Limiplasma sp.]HRX09326.1 nitroreductase family protein [Candidatus Limiplasma sp.]